MNDSPTDPLREARVLIVGTGPMGLAAARRALGRGAAVTIAGRSAERLQAAGATVPDAETALADTEQEADAQRLLARDPAWDHVLVVAGTAGASASSIVATPLAEAKKAYGRLWLTYNVLRAVAGNVGEGGPVTVLGGSSGRRPMAGFGVWGSLHGSLESLAMNAALELAPVRVNVISPGGIGIRTDRQLVPHRGEADDIAAMACALMENPAVTNTVVDVDGGERLGTYPSAENAWAAEIAC